MTVDVNMLTKLKSLNPFYLTAILLLLGAYSLFLGTRFYLASSNSVANVEKDRNAQFYANTQDYWLDRDLEEEHPTVELDALNYQVGDVIGTIEIPRIEVDNFLIEGANLDILRRGVGHYESTALPGEEGNFVFTAHRSSFGELFREADQIMKGDKVIVGLPTGGKVIYEVTDSFIVKPSDTYVIDDRGGSTMTLITCDPVDSVAERLIIYGDLVEAPVKEVQFIKEINFKTSGVTTQLIGSNQTFKTWELWTLVSANVILLLVASVITLLRKDFSSILIFGFIVTVAAFPLIYGIVLT